MTSQPIPQADDNYPQIDARETDRQLSDYFANNYQRYSDFTPMSKGGSGVLESCRDNNLGRTVVMKVLHPQLAKHEHIRARFLREARITAQLQHPNTVPVYEIGRTTDGSLYFTMKKIQGETLRDILEAQSVGDSAAVDTYNLDRMLGIIIQVCNALAYAHAHGVVHRDVKPENILIGSFGEVILIDWGVAKVWAMDEEEEQSMLEHQELTDIGQRPGTPLYMSPEQVRGGSEIDARTDVYSIGCVLYEILTLKEPLRGERINETFEMILRKVPVPPSERAPERRMPKVLAAITMRALKKKPDDRFQDMNELIDALREFRSRAIQSLTEN